MPPGEPAVPVMEEEKKAFCLTLAKKGVVGLYLAIDGPAGAGKSTIARLLSRRLKVNYLDTGAMYRAITLKILREKVGLSDERSLQDLLNNTGIELVDRDTYIQVYLDGEDVTEEIRGNGVNRWVSQVSRIKLIREAMVKKQRELAEKWGGAVMDGRDIGTCVLPDATYKFYLDASLEERARRRWKEMRDKEKQVDLQEVKEIIIQRDEIDRSRSISPLRVAPGAVVIDTTELSIDEVTEEMISHIKQDHT